MNIYWLRRDLRLIDNMALNQSLANDQTLAIYCLDQTLLFGKKSSSNRTQILLKSLIELAEKLTELGTKLLVISGKPEAIFYTLQDNNPTIQKLYFNEDYSPYSATRDDLVKQTLKTKLDILTYKDQVIFSGTEILKADSKPYTIFTAYKRKWLEKLQQFAISDFEPLITQNNFVSNTKISKLNLSGLKIINLVEFDASLPKNKQIALQGGERESRELLTKFTSSLIDQYSLTRNNLAEIGTSRLSVALKFGLISIRELVYNCLILAKTGNKESIKSWLNELIWREFYQMILSNFPEVTKQSFQVKYRKLSWEDNPNYIAAWKEGKTGYPIIDAAMRQLNLTGWIPNRARMIVAMFLTKDLLCDWKIGEEYFMQKLIDGDIAANNGGWQWSAGTGNDAAPYFRIFNPLAQAQRFDPEANYIKQFIPELKNLPAKIAISPWLISPLEEIKYEFSLEKNYHLPIIEHQLQRKRTLELYKTV